MAYQSPHSDTRLRALQTDLNNLINGQRDMLNDISSLRSKKEAAIQRITREYDTEIEYLERKRKTAESKIPDIQRQIDRRQQELDAEAARNAKSSMFGRR